MNVVEECLVSALNKMPVSEACRGCMEVKSLIGEAEKGAEWNEVTLLKELLLRKLIKNGNRKKSSIAVTHVINIPAVFQSNNNTVEISCIMIKVIWI